MRLGSREEIEAPHSPRRASNAARQNQCRQEKAGGLALIIAVQGYPPALCAWNTKDSIPAAARAKQGSESLGYMLARFVLK